MQHQRITGLQQCRLPARFPPCVAQQQQYRPQRHNSNHRQPQQPSTATVPAVVSGCSKQACRHAARPRQPLRHVATAAAAAADMGGSHSFRLSAVRQLTHIQKLLQPSKYDAELLSLAVPALAAMALEPLMNVFSAGKPRRGLLPRTLTIFDTT